MPCSVRIWRTSCATDSGEALCQSLLNLPWSSTRLWLCTWGCCTGATSATAGSVAGDEVSPTTARWVLSPSSDVLVIVLLSSLRAAFSFFFQYCCRGNPRGRGYDGNSSCRGNYSLKKNPMDVHRKAFARFALLSIKSDIFLKCIIFFSTIS